MTTFGCYIYGFGRDSSYMHWGGYQECGHSDPDAKADQIDNDCDGRVDEEKKDGKDNDKDGMIDEDLNNVEDYLGSESSRWLVVLLSITLVLALGGLIGFMVSIYKRGQPKAKPIGIPVIYYDEESWRSSQKGSHRASRTGSPVQSRRGSFDTKNRSIAGSSGTYATKMSRRSSPVDDAYAKMPQKFNNAS
ncbi:unnamed protein product, partial [Lymnaea stagnalis]